MAHSERKRSWLGRDYIQHYDDSGNKIGKSFDKKNFLTNNVKTIHTDQNNNKVGSSENIKDALTGKTHTQHYDQDGNPTSYTEQKKNIFGKYKSYTKSGKKRTTQEYLAYTVLIGLAIYFIVKVILPLAFVLTTPVITIIALVNLIKSKDLKYFKYSLVFSTLFILDYLLKGFSSYLIADGSFISKNLYLYLGFAFVCFSLSAVLFFNDKLNQILLKLKIENKNLKKSISAVVFLILLTPFCFIENKFLHKLVKNKGTLETSTVAKSNLDQSTVDNSLIMDTSIEKLDIKQSEAQKSNFVQSNNSNVENRENNNKGTDVRFYPNGMIMSKGKKYDGEYIEYFENGQIKAKENYLNGAHNGNFFYYYKNGNMRLKITYEMSALNGEYIQYYENGQIKKIEYFEKLPGFNTGSKKVGKFIEYYDNGQIKKIEHWRNDREVGEWIDYYPNGEIKWKQNYGD
jgi:antitoxin component YwqK of YwqJK toxin-antitoxin module